MFQLSGVHCKKTHQPQNYSQGFGVSGASELRPSRLTLSPRPWMEVASFGVFERSFGVEFRGKGQVSFGSRGAQFRIRPHVATSRSASSSSTRGHYYSYRSYWNYEEYRSTKLLAVPVAVHIVLL